MQDPVKWLQQEGGQWQVANLLHLKVPIHLFKPLVLVEGLLQLLQHHQVSVDILVVVIHRALVQILQDNVTDLSVVTLQMGIASTLPEKCGH